MIYQISWLLVKNINRKLLSCLFLGSLFLPTVAIANNPSQSEQPTVNISKAEKSPQRREPPSDYSRAGGSRGCPGENIPLTVLAPNTFVGKTTSVRPTFTWFVSNAQPTEFRLFEVNANESTPKKIGKIRRQSRAGINQLSLPENLPALTVGTKYIWQVSINCPDSPVIQRAEFEVVQKSSALDNSISKAVNHSQKASIYAEQNLWYEALEEALEPALQGKLGQVGSDLVQNLAQLDSFIPKQLTPDRVEILKQEIQQRRNYLEKIAGEN